MLPSPYRSFLSIEKKNPLKQGLKPVRYNELEAAMTIEKKNPLKQGLKPAAINHTGTPDTELKRRIH